MKKYTVTFLPSGEEAVVDEGQTILAAAEEANVYVNSACGGEGTCGRCRVIVQEGDARSKPTPWLEDDEIQAGYALACQTAVHSDLKVLVPPESSSLRARTGREETSRRFRDLTEDSFLETGFPFQPLIRKIFFRLSPPSLEDNSADLKRLYRQIRAETGITRIETNLDLLRGLPGLLRASSWEITATLAEEDDYTRLIQVEAGDTSSRNFGLAVDIGTTTVVAHLLDLNTGRTLDGEAMYNSQITFGEDVIRRIIRAEEDGPEELTKAIRGDINALIGKIRERTGVAREEINAVICAGNTTMISLLLRLPPDQIRREPYIPPAVAPPSIPASAAGIEISRQGRLECVPGIASWVGGDITAGIIASQMERSPALCLLVDIGTNGEIVLGNREWLLACSCSAGPAFEGSGMPCGMRASGGAIDKVDFEDSGKVSYRCIDGRPPAGICGSGLLDLVYGLFRTGILGRDGKFNKDRSEERLRVTEEEIRFILVPAGESATGKDIFISQADIDNLIRAKGAIYAGISLLLKSVSIPAASIKRLYISGGFGNYLNIRRAVCLGLLPDLPEERIQFIGNGSVRGTKIALLSRAARATGRRVAGSTTYFELSTDPGFMDEYTSAMFIPHTNIELFPGCDNLSAK